MPPVARQVPLLLLPEDEARLLRAIRDKHREVVLLDNVPWRSADEPPVRESIGDCGNIVTLWHPGIHPVLPVDTRVDGTVFGPSSGPVIQWIRSLRKEAVVLTAGRWAAAVDKASDPDMAAFVGSVWKVLNGCTTNLTARLAGPGPDAAAVAPERGVRVGEKAAELALQGALQLRWGMMYLRPES
ncbi:hypothetical protein [Streptomyces glaucus]|uniref:Uncharacterized protein n=1 Tax=Streptomyces glaucus TaxID=284029 RepID=A0ABN3K2L1_9ACTN